MYVSPVPSYEQYTHGSYTTIHLGDLFMPIRLAY